MGLSGDLAFHFLFGSLGDVDFASFALESQKLVSLIGRVDFFLVGVDCQVVLFQKMSHLGFILSKGVKVWCKHNDVVGIAGINHSSFVIMAVHLFQKHIGEERGRGRSGHHAVFFLNDLAMMEREIPSQQFFKKVV